MRPLASYVTAQLTEKGLRPSPKRSSEKFALRVGLVLYHRFRWLYARYGVRVPVHYLLGALLGSIDHRDPKSDRGDVLSSAHLALRML